MTGHEALNWHDLSGIKERFALASDVYSDKLSTKAAAQGWQRVMTADDVPGITKGGLYAALYKRTVNGKDEHVMAFRGMDGIRDWDDVAKLALGRRPDQVEDGYRFAKEAIKKFNLNPNDIEYVGHSMGGYLSKAVGLMTDSKKIYAFNSPGLFKRDLEGLPKQIMREFGENKADITEKSIFDKVLSINSKWDPVTWIGNLTGKTVSLFTEGRPHKLSSLENSFNRAATALLDTPKGEAQPVLSFSQRQPAALQMG